MVDFSLSEEERAVRRTAREFAEEEIARVDAGMRAAIGTEFGTRMIREYGTEAQKEWILRGVAEGELIGALGNTEPAHGSDAAAIETTAEKEGDEYVIDGVKTFITHGTIADYVLTTARTGPEGHAGISAFVVETDRDGFAVESEIHKMGWNASETAQLRYDGVRVPEENLVGAENARFYQLMDFFETERVGIAAQALGIAQGCLDEAVAYVTQREQFDRELREFQAVQHKIADMGVKVENARRLTYDAAARVDDGEKPTKLASMAKLYASEIAEEVASDAVQLHGVRKSPEAISAAHRKPSGLPRTATATRATTPWNGSSVTRRYTRSARGRARYSGTSSPGSCWTCS